VLAVPPLTASEATRVTEERPDIAPCRARVGFLESTLNERVADQVRS
jgi:hypothetical protein